METQKSFDDICTKIGNLCFGGPKIDKDSLIRALDELNSLNHRYTSIKTPTKALFLVTHLCSTVSPEDSILVDKCSQFIMNLLRFQQVTFEGRTLIRTVDWCIQATNFIQDNVLLRVLEILGAIVRQDTKNNVVVENVITKMKKLLGNKNISPEVILTALQCLETCVLPLNDVKSNNAKSMTDLNTCADIFIRYLLTKQSFPPLVYSRILGACLLGLQSIVFQHPKLLQNKLGILLGIVKSYILYGLPDINFIVPQDLKPSTLMVPEMTECSAVKDKRGIRGKKTVKHRDLPSHYKEKKDTSESFGFNREYMPAVPLNYNYSDGGVGSSQNKTSDSDFSDSEGGKLAKLNHFNTKIRQAALSLFFTINKQCEKPILFAYLTNFLPEVQTSGKHNLYTSILKDPSSRCRMAALNIVSQLLILFKSYLMLAEFSEKNTSFTSFSTVLGLVLVELHKVLCLALNDTNILVVTQVLKCLAALVQATPYHKMPKGLVSKVTRNVKIFIFSKDSSVQVTALIVMGCLISSESITPETVECITRIASNQTSKENGESSDAGTDENSVHNFDYAQFSDDDDEVETSGGQVHMSWLLKKCLNDLSGGTRNTSPIPVKLESLQIIAAMARSYFKELIQSHLDVILTTLEECFADDHTVSVKLHAGRAVESIGQAINKHLGDSFEGMYFDRF